MPPPKECLILWQPIFRWGGGTLTGGLTGTSLTLSGLSILVGANLSGVLNASSTAHFTATSTFGNLIRIEGTGTSTILGRLSLTATSTMAGYKICTQENNVCVGGAFTSSGGLTTLRTATDLVGIGTSTPSEKLSINGGAFFDSDIIRYGSSSAPTLNFRYFASSTSTIPNLTKNVFSFATSSTASPSFLSLDTLNYRVGIGTTSPIATFALKGSQYLTGGLGVGNATTTSGLLETSGIAYIGGILKGASTFTFAGSGASTMSGALGIATTSPAERFSVNGGIFFDSDIIRYGSSSAPTLNFRYFASATSTIPNLTSAFTYATSTTNTPLLTLSTKSSRYGRVGIGTSSPSALFAINALNASNQADNLFYIGSSTANNFLIDNRGFVGIGTSSPGRIFSVGGTGTSTFSGGVQLSGGCYRSPTGGCLKEVVTIRKTADESVNNSTTLQNDDELFLAMAANETWYFTQYTIYQDAGTSADIKFSFTIPTGATLRWGCFGGAPDTADAFSTCPWNDSGSQSYGAINARRILVLMGVVRNGSTAGNLQFQWAQNTATVGNTTVFADSYLEAHK